MDCAKRLGRPQNESFDRCCIERIDDQWNGVASCFSRDLGAGLPQPRFRPRTDCNVAALAGQLPRYGLAHAGAAARNDGFLAMKLEIHVPSSADVAGVVIFCAGNYSSYSRRL